MTPRKPIGLKEPGAATRIMDKWHEQTAEIAAEAMVARARPKPKLPRGPKPKFNLGKLWQLAEQYPKDTDKDLLRRYKQATADNPSLDWVRKHRRELRRQKELG